MEISLSSQFPAMKSIIMLQSSGIRPRKPCADTDRMRSTTSAFVADNSNTSHLLSIALKASFRFGMQFAAKMHRLVNSKYGGKSDGSWLGP